MDTNNSLDMVIFGKLWNRKEMTSCKGRCQLNVQIKGQIKLPLSKLYSVSAKSLNSVAFGQKWPYAIHLWMLWLCSNATSSKIKIGNKLDLTHEHCLLIFEAEDLGARFGSCHKRLVFWKCIHGRREEDWDCNVIFKSMDPFFLAAAAAVVLIVA